MPELKLKFESEKRLNDKDEEVKDDFGNIVYERNDVQILDYLLRLVDTNKIGKDEWLNILSVSDKIRERWRAEDFDCEIEFSVLEYAFLKKLFEKLESKLKEDMNGRKISLNLDQLRLWRDLNAQLNSKEENEGENKE